MFARARVNESSHSSLEVVREKNPRPLHAAGGHIVNKMLVNRRGLIGQCEHRQNTTQLRIFVERLVRADGTKPIGVFR